MNSERGASSQSIVELVVSDELNKLTERRDRLNSKLGVVAAKLAAVVAYKETHEMDSAAKLTITSSWLEFKDSGYVGGFETSWRYRPTTIEVLSSSLLAAYLATIANSKYPISDQPPFPCRLGPAKGWGDYLSVNLDAIDIPGHAIDEPPEAIVDAFAKNDTDALEIIGGLHEKALADNPYSDIPIQIDIDKLIDTLTRKEIMKYSRTIDPQLVVLD
ncbi:MAG TPA: hypothetical protein VFQ70_04240 [Candidatus Saccharimonadaceae bacterium]|nr:hypothetical protein [Candidatus Saccharimonadaceae bacterium]